MARKENYKYPGTKIDVEWDSRLCIHIGECGRAEGELFVGGRKPWCQPDLASTEEVIEVVERCPTGALVYNVKDQDITEQVDCENSVTVSYNGPYFVRGDLEVEGIPEDMPGVAFRAALCRCGHSKNKPLCDNSHEDANFKDYGAVGQKGEAISGKGGKLTVTPLKDGPVMLSGNITMTNGSGRVAWTGTKVALCRCGASKNKPFCDGTHMGINFKT